MMIKKEKPKILIVDDVPANIIAMKKILKKIDAEIFEATNGNDALTLTIQHDFALVLLDVQMPNMDGYEVAENMRSLEQTKYTPIIFVTAKMMDETNIKDGYAAGAVDYIMKPVDKNILLSKVGVFIDLYEQKTHINRLRLEAEESSKLKSEFLANMSHEIRTPLNVIIGMTELMLHDEASAEQHRKLSTILYSGETLLELINDILDFSKIESNELILEAIPFDLQTLAEEVTDALAIRAYEKNIEFFMKFGESVPRHVLGDPVRIKQILYNIAGNAIKFTKNGHVSITLEAEKLQNDDYCLSISIQDTGIGIPKDKHDMIFNKFVQADGSTTREYGGTGLGLAICRRLSNLMRGNIKLESEVGEGSTFTITLQLKKDTSKGERTIFGKPLKGMKILVIDDSEAIRNNTKEALTYLGAAVNEAENADAALALLKEGAVENKPFHLVLVDYHMPGVDGIGFARMVKKSKRTNDIVLVMMTAFSKNDLEYELRKEGFSGYLIKPLRMEILSKMLGVIWEDHKKGNKTDLITQRISRMGEFHEKQEGETQIRDGIKVLLVEDDATNSMIIGQMLEDLGCNVLIVNDGLQAVEEYLEGTFDLVFMDCHMPNMDGFEATRKIKELIEKNKLNTCPIVALTANALKGDREKCLEAGMDDYVTKPIRQEVLKKTLAKYYPDTGKQGKLAS